MVLQQPLRLSDTSERFIAFAEYQLVNVTGALFFSSRIATFLMHKLLIIK
jgi:hypothetical protein